MGALYTEPPGYTNFLHQFRMVDMYYRAMPVDLKEKVLRSFIIVGGNLQLIFATSAFGLGIDCPDIRRVYHWGPPNDLDTYVQESGRAGRVVSFPAQLPPSIFLRAGEVGLANFARILGFCVGESRETFQSFRVQISLFRQWYTVLRMSQLCIACERSLKSNQRRTLKSSEKAQSFLTTFGKIAESFVRSMLGESLQSIHTCILNKEPLVLLLESFPHC